MDKLIINIRTCFTAGMLCVLIAAPSPAGVRTVVKISDFTNPSLPAFWLLDDEPASYDPCDPNAGVVYDGAVLRFNGVGNAAFAHIETPSPIDVIRADAITRQDNFPQSTWGMGVGIYFDADNWVSLKQGAAGGQNGWMRQERVNGTVSFLMGNTAVSLRTTWLISGVELTATEIIFYGSQILPILDHFGETDIDGNVSEITELRMARPASFTGNALVIIGKGYTDSARPNPDFDNGVTSANWALSGIDYVRVRYNVPDPNYCGDAGTVYLEMDFNQDCLVDFDDLADFTSYWLECTDPQDAYCDQFWR